MSRPSWYLHALGALGVAFAVVAGAVSSPAAAAGVAAHDSAGGLSGSPLAASIGVEDPVAALPDAAARDTQAPRLRAGKLVFDSRRRVRLKLRCPTHETLGCRGTLTIATVRKIPARILRQAKLAAGKRVEPVRVVFVRKLPFLLRGASTRTVSTRLRKKHVRLLRWIGRTRVDVTLIARDVAGNVARSKRRVVMRPPTSR